MARIVLNTFGSFGDLHPYLAVAIGLKERGHDAVIATSEVYREKVEGEGVGFSPVRPDVGELLGNEDFIKKLWHPQRGTEYLVREYIMPHVAGGFEDLLEACRRADLLLTHAVGYAGPLVAEKQQLPWLSVALQPAVFMSVYDPPALAPAPWLQQLRVFGPGIMRAVFAIGKRITASWGDPIREVRRQAGLPPTDKNPLFEGQFSPFGTLALFSSHFARPQPDWPKRVICTGFPFYDRESSGKAMGNDLIRFLDASEPPIVFTLGSSAVMSPGEFFQESRKAAEQLGVRAVLLVGMQSDTESKISDLVYATRYAPYSELLPRAAVTVHQGGIGTTAQALRAGRPMLVVPWAHDQPDNAARIRRLGVGTSLSRKSYKARNVAAQLERLLKNKNYAEKAKKMQAKIENEDGVSAACDAIEATLMRL